MYLITNEEQITDNFIYEKERKVLCQLIISPNNVIYYSNGLTSVNACRDEKNINLQENEELQRYEYNKLYLNFYANNNGYGMSARYFIPSDDGVYCFDGSDININLDLRNHNLNSKNLSRNDLENFYNQFESLYILNTMGALLYAKTNGEVKLEKTNQPILPTEKEICLLDSEERKNKHLIRCAFNSKYNTKEYRKEANRIRNIEEIENLKLFGPSLPLVNSSNILIGVKNGQFEVYWFNLYYKKRNYISLGDVSLSELKKIREKQSCYDYTIETSQIEIKVPNFEEKISFYQESINEVLKKSKIYQDGK